MKVLLALFCCVFVAHGANVLRIARNTEAIIPSIVEEILKVELKSDLKKNSAIEVEKEMMPSEETRTIVEEPKVVVTEEKTPVIVETMVESIPQVRTVVLEEKKVVPEVVEKVEIIAIEPLAEKPVDNFRTESMPVVAEIVKETVVVEPVAEIRSEPVSEVVMKEEEIIKPMVRNVVKEEIPQVEELRNVPEMDAVKDTIPEPVAASNIVQPAVEVEPQVKTVVFETIKEEIKMPVVEEIKIEVKSIPEMIMMTKAEEVPEMMMVKAAEIMMEEKKMEEMIKDEVKSAIVEEEMKKIETEKMIDEMTMAEPAAKGVDGRQSIIQQASQAAINTLSQVPVIGQIVQRITPTTPEVIVADAPADETANEGETPAEEVAVSAAAPDATTRAPGPVQQLLANVQSGFQNQVQNVQSFLTGSTATNAVVASDAEADSVSTQRPNVIEQIGQGIQSFVAGVQTNLANIGNQVQSVIRPPTTSSPTKTDESPDEPAEPVAEEGKSVEPQAPAAVEQPDTVVVVTKVESPVEKVVEKVEMQS